MSKRPLSEAILGNRYLYEAMAGCTILVSGLPKDVVKDDLQIYFQSKNKSGGGDIGSIEVDGERGEAKIEFLDASVTDTVIARTHKYQGCHLTVQKYIPSTDECACVLVTGLSDNCTKDALEVYFENARRSGGGEVSDVQMKGDAAIITFTLTNVAKRVIARRHEYQGCQLNVQEYKPPTNECAVLVSGFSDKCTKDALEMYFENTRRSGGGEVSDVQMEENKAVVTFTSSDVAQRVLARTHEYQGCRLTVQEYKPSTDKCASVLVSGFSNKCTKDTLEMYFESFRRSGGGDVTDVQMKGDKAVVTFASANVASRVLGRKHEFQGSKLTLQVYEPSIQESASVMVSGLSDKCTKDALEVYFENARRSGGGEVTDVDMKGDKAVVTFASPDDAKRVLSRTHEYQGCQLTVQEYKPSTDEVCQDEHECACVLVSGISNKCTKDAIEMYFENARRSGGGDVTDVQMKGDKAVVTFASPDDAKRVLSRTHEYQGCQLTVQEYKPPKDECACVLVSGFSDRCTKDALVMYFENARRSGGGDVTDVEMKGDTAVVTFASPDDAKRVLSRTHGYQGCQLTVQEYKPSTDECARVLVSGISDRCTKDDLELYFENARRSGGGDVTDVQMKGDKAVVTFASPDVCKRVLTRAHEYQGFQLAVEGYRQIGYAASQNDPTFPTVSGMPDEYTEDMIHSNNQWSGNDEITKTHYNDNQAVASKQGGIVTNSDFPALTESKPPVQQQLENEVKEEPPLPRPRVVRVSGDPAKLTNDTLSIIFENKRLSGGGKIEDISCMPKEGMADITFRSPVDAKDVAQKEALEFDGSRFTMILKKYIFKDPKTFHVMGISEISEERFIAFIEWISEEKVESTLFGSNLNAIVSFENPPDLPHLFDKCNTTTLDGNHLKIEQVNMCDCIEVTGLAPNTTNDTVFYYFDNPINGGGKVEDIKMDSDNTRALVFFEDPTVVNRVTKQCHTIKGTKLKVIPFYPFGEFSVDLEGLKKEEIEKVNPQTMEFIGKFFAQEFDRLLQEHRIKCTWQQSSGEIVLGCAEPKMDKKTWENSCEAILAYINQIVTKEITVSPEAWNDMCIKAKEIYAFLKDRVAITYKEEKCCFTLTGKESDVSVLADQLNDLNSEIQQMIDFERNKVSDSIDLTKAQLELFNVSGFVQDLQAKCKDLEVKSLENDEKIKLTIRGPDAAVRKGKDTVLQTLTKVREAEMELSKSILNIICSDTGNVFMKMQFKQAGINAVVSFDSSFVETELMVTAMNRAELKKAVKLIKDLTSEQGIPLDDHQKQLLHTERWKQLKLSIQQIMMLHVREEPSASILWIAGIKEDVDKAKEKVDGFFKESVVLEKTIEADSGRVTYIFKYKLNAIQNIESSLNHFSVKITKTVSDKNGILVSGTSEGVKQAALQVEELINDIRDRKIDLETQGIKRLFKDKKGTILLSGVENNHNCIVELCEQKHDTKPTTSSLKDLAETKSLPGSVCSYFSSEGKKIILYKGDITEHKVDVLVNPANQKLKHDGGVGKKIVEKGGQEIQDECNTYVKQNGDLKCTETLVTGAGKLCCEKVVHAVGPKWNPSASNTGSKEQNRDTVSLLDQTVYNSLKKAESFSSIAIPALGAGANGFPVAICAKALIESAIEYSKKSPNSKLSEIHFVDMNDSVVKAFHNEMKTRFGSESSFTDQATPKLRPKTTKGRGTGNVGDDSNSLITAHGMKMKIVVEDIAKMKTHAIVNTVASDLDLSKNPCAKAISIAAGPGLQKECNTKGNLSAGEMVVTDGHDLECMNVFHVVVPGWEQGKGEPRMRSLIKSCLKEADKRMFSSIAFPAIGTGNLGFPRDVVARAFFEEADTFRRENPQSLLHEVHIVLFHKDQTSVQVFQNEVKNRKTKRTTKKKGERHIYTAGSSSSPFIGPVRLEIVPGDITQENTDAIVMPTTTNLKVANAGKLGVVINEKGGPGIQQECDQLGNQDAGSVVCTSAGFLPATKIFHLVFGLWFPVKSRMTEILVRCLKQADTMGIKSIAVPAIGTGKGGMNPKEAAKKLLTAVEKFSQGNPNSVNHIRIVVFPNHMITDFHSAITDLSESKTSMASSVWEGIKTGAKGIIGKGEKSTRTIETAFSSVAQDEKMWLKVFAASNNDLDKAEASIKELIKGNLREIAIKHNSIGKLSDSKIRRIQQIREDLPDIKKIHLDKENNCITILGDSMELNKAGIAINDILNETTEEEHTRKYAELLAESGVRWYYMDGGAWEPYDDQANAKIEQAYKEKKPSVDVGDDEDEPSYHIDFNAMTETNIETHETTLIEKRIKATGIQLPIHWDPQPTDSDGKELVVHLALLDPKRAEHAKEYDDVKKAIEKTSAIDIVKIERVQNPSRYKAYVVKKHELDDKSSSNEKKLFHGTAFDTCELINHKGFNRSYCGKNATYFGKGVYFARNASYSMRPTYSPPDSTGNRYMYLASVLVGEYTKGTPDMITPPPKDPSTPTITYDSVVNDVSNPSIYVVFHDDQKYPEYLITFK